VVSSVHLFNRLIEHSFRVKTNLFTPAYAAECVEGISVLKNSPMVLWSPDQGLKHLFPAVFWPWFGSVEFIFYLPTGQIATFSTRWGVLRT
jgi:hypothetical protein